MRYIMSTFILEHFPGLAAPVFGLPIWYWVSIFLALVISFVIASFLRAPLSYLLAFLFRQKEPSDRRLFIENLRGPIRVLATLVVFLLMSTFIKNPDQLDHTMSVAIKIALFLSITYLC